MRLPRVSEGPCEMKTALSIAVAALFLFIMAIRGMFLMFAVGVAHGEWLPNMPTLGFFPAVVLIVLLTAAFNSQPLPTPPPVR